jgi:hypothetical protein
MCKAQQFFIGAFLSQNLKLNNIVISITTFSSKFPCLYGECYKDDKTDEWVKEVNRTFKNISDNQMMWCNKSRNKKGNRKFLKDFKNCEFQPLISNVDPDTPILYSIPPPPLHTILLGPVNHIISHMIKKYPGLVNIIEKLHI